MEIHVIDSDPYSLSRGGGLTDTSLVEKYRLSDEAYDKRKGTMRDYIRQQREKDPNYRLKEAKGAPKGGVPKGSSGESEEPPAGPETVAGISVGGRCQVMPGARRGTVAFVGPIEQLKPGYWVRS
jgi:tubulin-folding cofactor B